MNNDPYERVFGITHEVETKDSALKPIKPKDNKLSSAVEAAIKNIELHMAINSNRANQNGLLDNFAIPQLKQAVERLKK